MNLLTDDIKKLYFKFLLPSLGSAMVMSIYTLTDAIVIGKGVGADALAALSLATPLLCVLMATGILFGVGGSVQVSVQRGNGNKDMADNYFTLSLIALGVVTAILWIIYSLYMPEILETMGADYTLFPYAYSYMKYIIFFLPVAVFSNFVAILIRADNDPNRAMAGVLLGGVVNIVLDIVLVFPLKCGIGGAAIASAIGMTVQVIVGGSHFFSKKNQLKLVKPNNIFSGISMIIRNGIPSFFNEFANGFVVLLFNIQILKFCGGTALSVYSVISNCVILFNSLFTGVGQAIQPVISTNFGAKNNNRISTIRKMAYTTIIIMGMIFSLSGVLFPKAVSGVFMEITKDSEAIAVIGLRLYFIAFIPMGVNLLTSYYMQAILRVKQALAISLMRNVVLSVVCILAFPYIFGGDSLWLVMPIVEWGMVFYSLIILANARKNNL